ncbi:hypothetical protein QNH48_28665 [Neobacillus sp. YX16]|uniref:lipopolysaccharide biosynthesis protein n=1 Tax=Neobacillus sp. YX16 TaxID=3047874 RepID=UPI0024C4219C|nr:hypothetical protein [Neobacillus sp. YX16]WHZ02846.1 hypothetical protein QNH48_28665 [Neobacillus sp. YX16]
MLGLFGKYLTNEKDKEVIKNIIASFAIKGGALLISLASLPAYIRYFNNQEVLGVWFTILSVLTWILTFDFGIGNGLRNKLVGAIVRKNKTEILENISSAYIIIGAITILVSSFSVIIFLYINWNSVFNISETLISSQTLLFTIICAFLTIMLQFFFRLISFILYALQKSFLNNLIALLTSVSQLIFVLIAPSFDSETNMKILSIVNLMCVNLPLVGATFFVFKTNLKGCFPSLRYFNKDVATGILHLGGIFFWNQIMYTAITGTNAILITRFIGPSSVVDYQIYYRLFSIIGIIFSLSLTPMWSAITKALAENDNKWINKYFRVLNRLVVLVVLLHLLSIPFIQFIVDIWLGENSININIINALIFAVFGSVFVFQNVLSTFACGIGQLRLQAYFYTIGVFVKIIFVYFGIEIYSSWVTIVISDIIILLPYCISQWAVLKKQFSLAAKTGINIQISS